MTAEIENRIFAKKYRFLLVSALAAFIATLDASIVNVSLPTLAREFSVPVDIVAWVILAYTLTITATLLLVGRLAVKKGYRLIYIIGFGTFTVGSFLCAISGSIWQLIGSRVLQGLGASFLMASGPALVARSFPAGERGKGMGIVGTAVAIGFMSGPPLGGYLVSTVGWHSIFLINIPVGIFGIIYAGNLLKLLTPDNPETKIDFLGGLFQAVAVVFLLFFLNRLNNPEWPDEIIYGILTVSLLAVFAFIWRETHTDHPLLGLSIFGHRQFTLAISAMMIVFICNSSTLVLIPFFLEDVLHLIPKEVGIVLVTIPICTLIVAPVAGRISDAIGYRLLTTLGLSILVAGIFWISTLDQNADRFDVVKRLIIVGIGMGMFHSPNSSAMMSAVPKNVIGIASGLLAVCRNMGIAGGVAVSTAIFAYRKNLYIPTSGETEAFVDSFAWVVTAFGFVAIAAVIISALRKNRISGIA